VLICLAHAPDFALGEFMVRPSIREIEHAGNRKILEPRVMQVLVALVEANGAVVSRQDLVRRCWGGRFVGEDSINRCIARLRRIADARGTQVFKIETIARVGYRLVLTEAGSSTFSAGISAPPIAGARDLPAKRHRPFAAPVPAIAVAAIMVVGAIGSALGYSWSLSGR